MGPGQFKTFCDAAAQLLPQLGEYASVEARKRKPEDDALVRQLRVSTSALANAMMEVSRMVPPPMQPPPPMASTPPAHAA